MQSTNVLLNPNMKAETYGKIADMSSGCGGSALNSNSMLSNRSSFRDSAFTACSTRMEDTCEFIDENDDKNNESNAALYNFPWDFKNKANQLLLHTPAAIISESHKHTAAPPPPPQCPPPSATSSTPQQQSKILDDDDQYCAPWDLKLQEELFKKMSESKKTNSLETNSNTSKTQSNNVETTNNKPAAAAAESDLAKTSINTSLTRSNADLNGSVKSTNDSTPRQSLQPSNFEESNEYSPPWELKQSALMQTIQSQNTNTSSKPPSMPGNMSAPLCTSSATSTLTNTANLNSNPSALTSLFNQFSRTRLSTRSNTSSSSSTRSSTSSLSASSPPSIPPPPLPPSIPPPPPPTSASVHRCNSSCNHQSPRLPHRHNSSSSVLPGNTGHLVSRAGSNGMNSNCNSCSQKNTISHNQNSFLMMNNNGSMNNTNFNYLNDTSKFCSWGTNSSNSSNTNSFENTNSSNMCSSMEDSKAFSKQNRGSNHHFAYPSMTNHFQTAPTGGQQIIITDNNTLNNKNIQIGGIPVSALVFQQTSSLPANLLPLNLQQQHMQHQHSGQPLASPASLSHLHLLERQIWFHGKITRKHAENMLDNRPIGSFLIRQSESGNANDFSLSLVGTGVVHMRISMKNGEYILGQCSQPFNSIVKMVEHYGKVEVPIKGALHVRLTNPVPMH